MQNQQQNQQNPTIEQQAAAPVGVKQIIEAVGNAQNILVALSKGPDIEELTCAFALTLALDAAGKNATAIFSGTLPESIEFLNPAKVFETDTNSLQDFIISLNKEKADHLRYKVDGDFVRIYITPYRTMLSEKDLQFTRGDFNVDLVIALDVKSSDDFDAALAEHSKIMHNARVASIVVKSDAAQAKKFGDIIWQADSGTLTEAVTSLSESLNDHREISKEVATALLAGLVSVSDRFANTKTTPSIMNLAARLMSIGADQRAVMANLGEEDVAALAPTDVLPPVVEDFPGERAGEPAPQGSAFADEPPRKPQVVSDVPDGNPGTLPPPSELMVPKDDFLTPNASIIEEQANPVGYVDQLTNTAPAPAPTPPPAPVATPAPKPEPAPQPIKGGVPTVAEIQRLIKNRLPLPPEFDPESPMAVPPVPVAPIPAFGQPTAQDVNPSIDAVVPQEITAIKPVQSPIAHPQATQAPTAPTGNATAGANPPVSTSGAVNAPSIAAAPANAFKIPSF
jgi:hypothetical protein